MERFRSAGVVRLALALVTAHGVAAAEPVATDITTARRLFSEASELRTAGKWDEAAGKLREAIAIKETAGLRFHLAYCEEKVGHLLAAQQDYDRADELIRSGAKADDVAALLTPARAALAEHIPTLLVKLPREVPDAEVQIDGATMDKAGLSGRLRLDPGIHGILARAPAHTDFSLSLTLEQGEDRVVDVVLPAVMPPPPKVTTPLPPSPSKAPPDTERASFGAREATLLGEGVLAVAGATVGVVFLVKHGAAQTRVEHAADTLNAVTDDPNSACSGPSPDLAGACADLHDALDDRHRDAVISAVGFASGGAFAAAFAVTLLAWPSNRDRSMAVSVSPTPGGAVLHGTF